jgi:hypothetical protein
MQGPAEKTDVFLLSIIQRCKEWKGFQGHKYVAHAWDFGWEHTCDSFSSKLAPHHILHEREWRSRAKCFSSDLNWPSRYPEFSAGLMIALWIKLTLKIKSELPED